MPTYEYKCTSCNHKFEVFQSIKADPVEKCPSCSGKVIRLPGGGTGLIFKGSGFYITDYKKRSTSPSDGSSSKRETGSQKESNTSSETKKDKNPAD